METLFTSEVLLVVCYFGIMILFTTYVVFD